MIVCSQPSVLELLCLFCSQHTQRSAYFHPHGSDLSDHRQDIVKRAWSPGGAAPGRTHTETRRATELEIVSCGKAEGGAGAHLAFALRAASRTGSTLSSRDACMLVL